MNNGNIEYVKPFVKPTVNVYIKYKNESDTRMLVFNKPIKIKYSNSSKTLNLYDDNDHCVFVTPMCDVTYCHVDSSMYDLADVDNYIIKANGQILR